MFGKKRRRHRAQKEADDFVNRLAEVSKRVIGHLSKGYQQRVGLADALVHEPDLIILDEPTSGLDPNQIRSVRQLIKDLAGKHTVLLSTHILPEVEMTCSRVLILHEGRMLADDTPRNLEKLMSDSGRVITEIAAPLHELSDAFEHSAEIDQFDLAPTEGDYIRCSLTARPGLDVRPQIFRMVSERQWHLRELTRSGHSLEDIFVRVTRSDREEEG